MRILDANANRAREALRVMEDYARFALDSTDLSKSAKTLRHDLAGVLGAVMGDSILHRDTPGDVGREIKTKSELSRDGLGDVVIAAGKRAGEALRSIEEAAKTFDPAMASGVESIRYRLYDLEKKLAMTIRPPGLFARVRLYVLITESACRVHWFTAAQSAIAGGADAIQLREKNLDGGELLARARQLRELCRRHNVLFIVNDRADIAVASGADGVHVGQQDLPASDARRLVGYRAIVGVSTHNLEQARAAVLDGADYIGIGPVFPSATKPRDFIAGLDTARAVAAAIPIPAVAIAGIDASNIDQVWKTGVAAVAVTQSVLSAPDIQSAAESLRKRLTDRGDVSRLS
jgi:thiamine-phosphate pyrophosphorylase